MIFMSAGAISYFPVAPRDKLARKSVVFRDETWTAAQPDCPSWCANAAGVSALAVVGASSQVPVAVPRLGRGT
jgi:hypothetical protein